MSRLNDLIRQLHQNNPALADDIRIEVAALADRRSFGLNFERHVPEAVELPGRRVRRGDKVRVLPPRGTTAGGDERLWQVTLIVSDEQGGSTAELSLLPDHAETSASPVDDLVIVAEFRDPIYPGLVSTGRLEHGGDSAFHCVINAENYHALQALLFTHRGTIDCIYIDPPYNTGKDEWIYNDRYVNGDDLYRHSKWLAFMERRLVLARELLKDTGVIIVAIGDDQHHRLRMLLDQVFDESNFISDVVWQGGRKNDSRYVSNGADYMLMYARDESAMAAAGIRWREKKAGVDAALAKAAQIWEVCDEDIEAANSSWKAWLKVQKVNGASTDSVNRFDRLDPTSGRPINTYGNITWPGAGGAFYDVVHPTTGRPVKRPTRGWVFRDPARMQQEIDSGRIWFGEDENTIPRGISFLDELATEVALSVFVKDRKSTTGRLRDLLGEIRFPNPKDVGVLLRWLSLVSPANATILDFFGGSGSTLEAVIRLNADDGGTRRCILVTNNEVGSKDTRELTKAGYRHGDPDWEVRGVHEYVTKPRITSVVTGERPDGGTHDDKVPANVEFFTLTYESPLRVESHRQFERIAPLLWMRAGSTGRRIDTLPDGWDVVDAYGIISDLDQAEKFLTALADKPDARMAFIITGEDRLFESAVRDLPEHVEPVRLYEAYLRNFEVESGRSAL